MCPSLSLSAASFGSSVMEGVGLLDGVDMDGRCTSWCRLAALSGWESRSSHSRNACEVDNDGVTWPISGGEGEVAWPTAASCGDDPLRGGSDVSESE